MAASPNTWGRDFPGSSKLRGKRSRREDAASISAHKTSKLKVFDKSCTMQSATSKKRDTLLTSRVLEYNLFISYSIFKNQFRGCKICFIPKFSRSARGGKS
jgi:hypothetical protein